MRTAWTGLEALAGADEEGRIAWTGVEALSSDIGAEFRTAWLAADALIAPPASIIRVYHLDAEVWVSPYEGEDPRQYRSFTIDILCNVMSEHKVGSKYGVVLG